MNGTFFHKLKKEDPYPAFQFQFPPQKFIIKMYFNKKC